MMRWLPEKRWFAAAAAAALITGALLTYPLLLSVSGASPLLCPIGDYLGLRSSPTDELKASVLHYATSKIVPQQSPAEIRVSYDVLRRRSPCNFLVFGLGFDSPMWSAFNAGGTTLFLEESDEWVRKVLKDAPWLSARTVRYRTRLDEADELLRSYKSNAACLPPGAAVRKGDRRCRLALAELPDMVYDRQWDLIMIDAPRGYFDSAPGRMAAIWSAAVMARGRRGGGATDVFLHDVDRKVEKAFALEFLCRKYLVGGTGRLWHFRIPPTNQTGPFC